MVPILSVHTASFAHNLRRELSPAPSPRSLSLTKRWCSVNLDTDLRRHYGTKSEQWTIPVLLWNLHLDVPSVRRIRGQIHSSPRPHLHLHFVVSFPVLRLHGLASHLAIVLRIVTERLTCVSRFISVFDRARRFDRSLPIIIDAPAFLYSTLALPNPSYSFTRPPKAENRKPFKL